MHDEPDGEVTVRVNARTCAGSRMCVTCAPDIFEIGAAGYSRVKRKVVAADLGKLREAEESCPTSSISVVVVPNAMGD
jgi:ferredoxin